MENLCPYFQSTGCDADGGYAEYVTARAAFAYPIPENLSDEGRGTAALRGRNRLAVAAIGRTSSTVIRGTHGFRRVGAPRIAARAGALSELGRLRLRPRPRRARLRVVARRGVGRVDGRRGSCRVEGDHRHDAGMASGGACAARVGAGGRLVVNAIRKSNRDVDELTTLDYGRDLWMEREIKSVANVTRKDVGEMLALASSAGIRPRVVVVPLERANDAVVALRSGGAIRGAQVLRVAAS
jgi:propanol-preferring alcohol dehydrogenase